MRKLQAFFRGVKPKRILDVATGNGAFIHLIARVYDDYDEMVGVDQSSKSLDAANATLDNERIKFIETDIYDLDESEQFDVITLSNSLHHFDHLPDLFAKLERLLNKGGYIIINEMMSDSLSKSQKSHMKIHHFAAEIDRHLGRVHNDTMASKDILQTLQNISNKSIIDAWDLVYPDTHEIGDEELSSVIDTIDRMLEKIDDEEFKKVMTEKALKMKKYIRKKGFNLATQMLVILGERK